VLLGTVDADLAAILQKRNATISKRDGNARKKVYGDA